MSRQRATIQKQLLLDAMRLLRHPTAEELWQAMKAEFPQISLATVYRNLAQMAEAGLILRLTLPSSPDRFDIQLHQHYHMQCGRCGRLMNVEVAYLKELDARMREQTGLTITGHNIVFTGTCPECLEKE